MLIEHQKAAAFLQVVVSSAFESSIGLSQYAHLAAALDSAHSAVASGMGSKAEMPCTAHGLGTTHWYSSDLLQQPLTPEAMQGPDVSHTLMLIRNCHLTQCLSRTLVLCTKHKSAGFCLYLSMAGCLE